MADAISPDTSTAIKVASALVHAQEYMSADGHPFDRNAFDALMGDHEVRAWMNRLRGLALLPRKRSNDESYG
jgi:hypothetical protein